MNGPVLVGGRLLRPTIPPPVAAGTSVPTGTLASPSLITFDQSSEWVPINFGRPVLLKPFTCSAASTDWFPYWSVSEKYDNGVVGQFGSAYPPVAGCFYLHSAGRWLHKHEGTVGQLLTYLMVDASDPVWVRWMLSDQVGGTIWSFTTGTLGAGVETAAMPCAQVLRSSRIVVQNTGAANPLLVGFYVLGVSGGIELQPGETYTFDRSQLPLAALRVRSTLGTDYRVNFLIY